MIRTREFKVNILRRPPEIGTKLKIWIQLSQKPTAEARCEKPVFLNHAYKQEENQYNRWNINRCFVGVVEEQTRYMRWVCVTSTNHFIVILKTVPQINDETCSKTVHSTRKHINY